MQTLSVLNLATKLNLIIGQFTLILNLTIGTQYFLRVARGSEKENK